MKFEVLSRAELLSSLRRRGSILGSYIGLFLLMIWLPLANAAPASTELTTILSNIKTLKANFTQTVLDNYQKPVQISYGKMYLQRPGKFRWEVSKPIPQQIIANESKLWIYDPDLEQVTIRSLKSTGGDSPALFLSHTNITLEKEYTVTHLQKPESDLLWFSLKPKKADSMFASIQMGFKQNQIKEMQLEDHIGHTTQIVFKNIQSNITIPASLFIFKPKPGIDVIDETKK